VRFEIKLNRAAAKGIESMLLPVVEAKKRLLYSTAVRFLFSFAQRFMHGQITMEDYTSNDSAAALIIAVSFFNID
jgi:hypothetical protein